MAIIQAGKTFTASDLKLTAGNLAAQLRDAATDGMQLKAQLDTWTDADLIDLGLTQEEANAIKGFFLGDLPGIYAAITGSTWIKQLLGLGQ
jgi:hypothetical protein